MQLFVGRSFDEYLEKISYKNIKITHINPCRFSLINFWVQILCHRLKE